MLFFNENLFMSNPPLFDFPKKLLFNLGLRFAENIYYQLSPGELLNQSIEKGEVILTDSGALVIDTGEFTDRSPKDKFIVKDRFSATSIDWNEFNIPIEEKYFEKLYTEMIDYLNDKKLWVRDCYTGASPDNRLNIRVLNENPSCNLFAYNMFLQPGEKEFDDIEIDWHLIQAPNFFADLATGGIPHKSFVIVNFTKQIILIGGTQYIGEMRKGLFSILN